MIITKLRSCNFCSGHHHDCSSHKGNCGGHDHSHDQADYKAKLHDLLHHHLLNDHSDAGHKMLDDIMAEISHNHAVLHELEQLADAIKGLSLKELEAHSPSGDASKLVLSKLVELKKAQSPKGQMALTFVTMGTILAGVVAYILGQKHIQAKEAAEDMPLEFSPLNEVNLYA